MGFVKVCIVCKKTSGNQIVDWDKSAHRFPNDIEVRKKWFEVLGLKEATTPKHARVCYKHFSRDQVVRNRLKRTAVPNRNLDVILKGEEVKPNKKVGHGLAPIQPKEKTVSYFEPSVILGCIKQVSLGVPIPSAPPPVSIVTPASTQRQLQVIQQMLSGTILSNSVSFAVPGGVSLNKPVANSTPSTSASQPQKKSTINSNDIATGIQIISSVCNSDPAALPSPSVFRKNVENEVEVIVLDDEDEDENVCLSEAVEVSVPPVEEEIEIVPKNELLLEEEEEEEEEELVDEDLVKLEESDKTENERDNPLKCDAIVSDVDPLLETSGAPSSVSTSLCSAPSAVVTALPPKPNLPPVPGVFIIIEGQVYQVASSDPTPVPNQETVETVTPSKKRETTIKCPFGCKKLAFSLLKINSLTRFCNHLGSCRSLKSKTDQNTDSKETLLFLHCPNCKDYTASLDSPEEKRSFVEHIGWCAENGGMPSQGIPLKFRLFQCSLCSNKKRYMNLEQYQKHCFHHSLRQNVQSNGPDVPWWCPWCNARFQNEHLREDHLKVKHSTQWEQCQGEREECEWCSKKYISQEELNLHQATGHVMKKYGLICDQPPCSKTFLSEKRYKLHRRLEHRVDLFRCDSCDQEFVSEKNYEKHLQKHAGNEVLKCSECNKQFKGKGASRRLSKHVLSHQDSYWIKCNLCGKQLCKEALQRHMIFVHKTRPRKYQCPHEDCDKAYHDKGLYQDHLSKHRGEKQHICRVCSKSFFFKYALSFHALIHKNLETSPHKCEICKRGFTTLRGLHCHDQRVHGEHPAPENSQNKPKKKKKRTKTSFVKPHLKKAVLLPSPSADTGSSPPTNFICDQCGKRYTTKVILYTHYQVHHLKRYQCTCHICGMKLLKSYHLRLHLSRVHGVGTYGQNKCPVETCGKVFYAPSLLQHHMTLHNGQGPQFSCDQCGKAFVFPRHLTLHLRNHSKQDKKIN